MEFKRQKFATGIIKTELTSFLKRTINECSIISDLTIHKLLTFAWHIFVKRHYQNWQSSIKKTILFEKYSECSSPSLFCINLRMDDLCKNQVHPSHYLCLSTSINWMVFLDFFTLLFPIFGSFIVLLLYSYFQGLCAFLWFHYRQKCRLRFAMGRLHVSLTSRALDYSSRGHIEKKIEMGAQNKKVWEALL